MQLAILTLLFYAFFLAVVAGMTIIQDDEWRLGDLIHATPLRPGEYVWGKFAAVLLGTLAVLAIHLAAMIFFNPRAAQLRGEGHAGAVPPAQLPSAGLALLAAHHRLPGGDLAG